MEVNLIQKTIEPLIAGLDIGTTKVTGVVGRRGEQDKLEVIAIGQVPSYGINRGAVSNIDKVAADIRRAVALGK